MANLDDTMRRVGAKIACHPDRRINGRVDDGIEQRIIADAGLAKKILEGGNIAKRAIGKIIPDHIVLIGAEGVIQPRRMIHVKRYQPAIAAGKDTPLRRRRAGPAGDRMAAIKRPVLTCLPVICHRLSA